MREEPTMKAEIERLRAVERELAEWKANAHGRAMDRIRELEADNERLRAALEAARDALRNDFEPDNQSRAYHAADAALRALTPSGSSGARGG